MALVKQTVSVPFTQGVDSKTDPIIAGKPSRVENMVVRGGTLQHRWGTSQLYAGGQTTGEAIFPFDSELVRLNGGSAYGLAPSNWVAKPGNATICTHSLKRLVRNSSTQKEYDHVYANGVTVTAWIDSGLHVAVSDETTGVYYQTGAAAVAGTGSHRTPRLVALGNTVLVFSCIPGVGGALYVTSIATASPVTAPAAPTSIEADLTGAASPVGGAPFDAVANGSSYAVVAYISGAAGVEHIQLIAVNSSGTVLGSPAKTDKGLVGNAGAGTNTSLSVYIDGNGVGYVFNFKTALYWLTFNVSSFAAVNALTQITGDGNHAVAAVAEATTGRVTVLASGLGLTNGGSTATFMGSAVVSSTAVTTAYANLNGTAGVVVRSEGFLVNGVASAVVVNDQTGSGGQVQATAWVLTAAGAVLAKMLPGLSGSPAGGRLVRPFAAPSGAKAILVPEQGNLAYVESISLGLINVTPIGVTRADISLAKGSDVPLLRVGEAVYLGGSLPRIYDGKQVVEAGHNTFAEEPTVALGAGVALAANSTYSWRVVFAWIDARGELQRSAPSVAVTASTAGATQQATLTIPTQRLTGRDGLGISTAYIEVYRVEGNGANYYRVNAPGSLLNDVTAATVTFVDTVIDATLIVGELLYTTGNVNDWLAPPAYTIACVHKTRLCIAGLDDPYEWRSSSVAIKNQMLRFNETWGGRVPPATGRITAMASMDGNLFVFTTGACYLVPGDGPDLLGSNNWPSPVLVTSVDAGALTWQSVATTPMGVVFQNARGLHLLNRGLGVDYIGADVEDVLASPTVRSVLLRPELEQLWVLVDLGTDTDATNAGCFVWDYHYQQWTFLRGYGGLSACYYQGDYCRVGSNGAVWQEQPNAFKDSASVVSGLVETAWLKVAGVQGFERIWRALLAGAGNDAFTLTVQVKYDYAGSYTEAAATFSVSPGGAPWQVRHHFVTQKCEAFKLLIQDTPTGGTGQGMSLTDLTLEYGIKKGARKLPAAQTG